MGPGPLLLSVAEVLLWLPPWDAKRVPGLRSRGGGSRELGLRLGCDDAGDPVVWDLDPREGHHLVVAGETGMGKSTLLQRIAVGVGRKGAAVVVLDPLGETSRGILRQLDPEAEKRAIWVSPLRSPVGINALEAPPGSISGDSCAERERRVGELVTSLRRIRTGRFGDTVYWGPRIEDILTRTLLVLSASPGATLTDAAELLSEPDSWVGPTPTDPEARRKARQIWESLRREPPEERQGALRVVQEVALSSSVSRLLSARSPRWSLAKALEPAAVTLFDLERTTIGVRASSYLGAAYLSLLWSHLLAREEHSKVVLLLDEVQEYGNDALNEMLRMGRRYNLHVLAATQSLASLPEGLRDSLVTNSRDVFLFRGSAGDARLAHDGLGVAKDWDLSSLPRGTALSLLEKGSSPLLLRTELPLRTPGGAPQEPDTSRLQRCLDRSKAFWAENSPPDPAPLAMEPSATALPGVGPLRADPPASPLASPPPPPVTSGPSELYALLVAALEAPEGEPFPVAVPRVRSICGEDERCLRRLGALLKGSGALVRTDRRDGERVWWLVRERIEGLVPRPWATDQLARGREAWERSAPTFPTHALSPGPMHPPPSP